MDDDDLAASRESSRKRAAEGERKSRSNSLSEQIDRNLRARFSDENSSRLAATSGVYSSGLLSREQHLLELSQLQRLRDLQLLASERVSQQSFEQPGLVYQYGGRNPRMPNMDELSAATSPNFGLPLDRQLNMYQSAGRESPATRDIGRILRDEAQSASYPLFREADQLSRFAPGARVAESPAVNSYMDLLEQLRHQELLNERLRQEAHRRERQQHQLHPRQERENPSTSVPQVSSAMTNVPYSRVHRTKKKLPSQQRLPMETAPTYKPGIPLELPSDKEKLTTYQALIRASLEYFKATQDDINTTVQGRRQKLQCGQSMYDMYEAFFSLSHRFTRLRSRNSVQVLCSFAPWSLVERKRIILLP